MRFGLRLQFLPLRGRKGRFVLFIVGTHYVSRRKLRRSKEDIIVGILGSCASNKLTITRLMAVENLSYNKVKQHLERLIKTKLVEYHGHNGRTVFRTTELGVEAVKAHRHAMALLNGQAALSVQTRNSVSARTQSEDEPSPGVFRQRWNIYLDQ